MYSIKYEIRSGFYGGNKDKVLRLLSEFEQACDFPEKTDLIFENGIKKLNIKDLLYAVGYLKIYVCGNEYVFERVLVSEEPALQIFTSFDFKRIIVRFESAMVKKRLKQLFNLLIYPLYQCFRSKLVYEGKMLLHCSCVVYKDEGILFIGNSGVGKSTQASLWIEKMDAFVLDYDKVGLFFRHKRIYALGSPWAGKENVYINACVPVKLIVFLEQSKNNKVINISSAESFGRICLTNYLFPLTFELEEKYYDLIHKLAESTRAVIFQCTKTDEAVEALGQYIKEMEE